jgi:hypothetical protein
VRPSRSPPSNGSTGSTPAVCSSRSGTFRLPRLKIATTPNWQPAMLPRRTQKSTCLRETRRGSPGSGRPRSMAVCPGRWSGGSPRSGPAPRAAAPRMVPVRPGPHPRG